MGAYSGPHLETPNVHAVINDDDNCASGAVKSWINFTDADESDASLLLHSDTSVVFVTVIMPIIMITGVVSNLALIFVVIRVPRMRNVTNFYLAQLAFADLSFLTIFVGGQMFSYFASPVKIDVLASGPASCIPIYFFTDFVHVATCFLVTVVSLEKCNAICDPLRYTVKRGRSRCIRLAVLAWLSSAGVAAMPGFTYHVFTLTCIRWPNSSTFEGLPELIATCNPTSHEARFAYALINAVLFSVFLFVNARLYVRIIRALHHRVVDLVVQNAALKTRIRTRNQVAKMLVVNGSVVFCLMTPHRLYSFVTYIISFTINEVDDIEHLVNTMSIFSQIFYFLLLLNSVVNPIIYNVMSAQYRRAFCIAFRCRPRRRFHSVGPIPKAWNP